MIVTFPHFGPLSIAAAQLFAYLGIPFVIPPENDRHTLETGASISPEEMCVPFKYMAGNLKKAWEQGADTALMAATCGPCRLGEYGELLKTVLEQGNCSFQWILLDAPSAIGMKELARRFGLLLKENDVNAFRVAKGLSESIRVIYKMDALRRFAGREAGFVQNPHMLIGILHEAEQQLKEAETFGSCFEIVRMARKRIRALPMTKGKQPVHVLITGEIYTSIEAEANGRLEEKLMMMGCSITRHIDLSWWFRYTLRNAIIPSGIWDKLLGKDGIPCTVGGYGRETVNRIVKGTSYDGIIKIMPSGCMPEIVTKAFCEKLQEEKQHRILHLIYDEMGGKAGYETRIEAFVDMLERKKYVLDGNRHRIHKHRSGFD